MKVRHPITLIEVVVIIATVAFVALMLRASINDAKRLMRHRESTNQVSTVK